MFLIFWKQWSSYKTNFQIWKYICKIKVGVFAILKNVANWPPKTSYTNLDSPHPEYIRMSIPPQCYTVHDQMFCSVPIWEMKKTSEYNLNLYFSYKNEIEHLFCMFKRFLYYLSEQLSLLQPFFLFIFSYWFVEFFIYYEN